MSNPITLLPASKEGASVALPYRAIPTSAEAYEMSITPVIHSIYTGPPPQAPASATPKIEAPIDQEIPHIGPDGQRIYYTPTDHKQGSGWS